MLYAGNNTLRLLYRYTQISLLNAHNCFVGYILTNILSLIYTKESE